MTKITEFPAATAVAAADVFLLDGAAGTKKVAAGDLPFLLFDSIPTMHKQLYRGKNLGTSFTAGQKAAIQNGTFTDLWVGDYWVIGGVNWRIADFNYWYGIGDTAFNTPHAVIVPDAVIGSAAWHSSSSTASGYGGSTLRASGLNAAKAAASAAFSTGILTHRELLTNASVNSIPSSNAWYDSTLDVMNECMLVGHYLINTATAGSTLSYRYTASQTQLALFRLKPEFISTVGRVSYWLRDYSINTNVLYLSGSGNISSYDATNSIGVRPVFAIG